MPGNCPAWLRPSAARLWKTFRSKPNTIPVDGRKCSPSHRNGVRLHNGMLFGFTTEWCSPLQRNRVRLRPDSPSRFRAFWSSLTTDCISVVGKKQSYHSQAGAKTVLRRAIPWSTGAKINFASNSQLVEIASAGGHCGEKRNSPDSRCVAADGKSSPPKDLSPLLRISRKLCIR
jgi:hypothetical protein